jgi:NAD(P)H-dependent flavin oxidoreductase YrpB (nitropropane dioxygenase family)
MPVGGDWRLTTANASSVEDDLSYMGTRFIVTRESMASDAYRQMLVDSTMDDLILTKAFTGLETSMLRPSIVGAGPDPAKLDESVSQERAKEAFGKKSGGPVVGPKSGAPAIRYPACTP